MIPLGARNFDVYENRWVLAGVGVGLVVAAVVYALFRKIGELQARLNKSESKFNKIQASILFPIAYKLDNKDGQKAIYRRILELNPNHASARNNLACLLPKGKEKQDFLVRAIQKEPTKPLYWKNLADTLGDGESILVRKKSMTKEELYREAIKLDENYVGALFKLAYMLPKKTDEEKTEKKDLYRRVLKLDPNHASACNNLACLLPKGKEKQDFLVRAIQKEPTEPLYWKNLADTLGDGETIQVPDEQGALQTMTKDQLMDKHRKLSELPTT